ncbi:hypothetical protein GCM10010498_31290 [Streptomyces cavourensis]|nr:hypothetical protein GCM10010498_31290 [Streptomyces cavourensis]
MILCGRARWVKGPSGSVGAEGGERGVSGAEGRGGLGYAGRRAGAHRGGGGVCRGEGAGVCAGRPDTDQTVDSGRGALAEWRVAARRTGRTTPSIRCVGRNTLDLP